MSHVTLPPYVIEAPDILTLDAVIPLPPYRVEPLDVLLVRGKGVPDTAPLNGLYSVGPDGTINLGQAYGGTVRVAHMPTDEVQRVVQEKVCTFAKAEVVVALAQSRGMQQISGQHIVRPGGTVGLGSYGSVYVAGMTTARAKVAIESHLAKYLYRPEVAVDVYAFNSKFYYVITDFAGARQQVARLTHTGNETVLDAVTNVGGLSDMAATGTLRVERPGTTAGAKDQVLPIDWVAITQHGITATNYQLLPGDRLYVTAKK